MAHSNVLVTVEFRVTPVQNGPTDMADPPNDLLLPGPSYNAGFDIVASDAAHTEGRGYSWRPAGGAKLDDLNDLVVNFTVAWVQSLHGWIINKHDIFLTTYVRG